MLRRRREEAALFRINEICEEKITEPRRSMKIGFVGTGFIEIDQPFGQVGVVFQIGVEMGATGSRCPE